MSGAYTLRPFLPGGPGASLSGIPEPRIVATEMTSMAARTDSPGVEAAARWAVQARGGRIPAIVLGGSVNGLSFVRSLGRRGVPTLLLDSEPLIGTHTRFGSVALLPPVDTAPDAWLRAFALVRDALPERPVVFATSDAHCVLLAEHRDVLEDRFRFIIPARETMERIVDKRLQYRLAEAQGVPIPRTRFPDSVDEARSMAADFMYPCILKPYKSHLGRRRIAGKVKVVNSPGELVDWYSAATADGTPFMIQEIVPGDDTALYGYLAFWDEQACERHWLTKQKLRQSSAFGDGAYQVTVDAPEVAAQSRTLLRALKFAGLVGVEFRRDPRDGVFRLMEINPRTVSGNQLAVSAGIDFPWLGYCHLTSTDPGPVPPFRRGVRYVNEDWDTHAYLALRRTGQMRFRDWAGAFFGAEAHAIGAWDDPGPILALLGRFARAAVHRRIR